MSETNSEDLSIDIEPIANIAEDLPQYEVPRKSHDSLLKVATQVHFKELLYFFYPNADELFDLNAGFTFLDKELHNINQERGKNTGIREADTLTRIHMKDGTEQLILLNVELEGSSHSNIARRVYIYNYRIEDKFDLPVASLVIYTGDENQKTPTEYKQSILNTSLHFKFHAYHIFDHSEEMLLNMNSMFGYIILACRKSLKEGKVPEEELGASRWPIARALIESNKYSNEQIYNFVEFLKNIVHVGNSELNSNFDKYIYKISGGEIDMGIIETVKHLEREEGKLEGKLENQEHTIRNLIIKLGLSDEQIAAATEAAIDYVRKIRASLKK